MKNFRINDNDNVAMSLKNSEELLRGHKYAREDIHVGDKIIKYGSPIGIATKEIKSDEHVHTHNMKTGLGDIVAYHYEPVDEFVTVDVAEKYFRGYQRYNGEVGIRNELWIVPTVGCVNGVATAIVDRFKEKCYAEGMFLNELDYFDGVYTWPHNYGCSQMGDDHLNTKNSLKNIVKHPNAGAVLVLGLGCENNQIDSFRSTLGTYDEERIRFMVCQEEDDEIAAGVEVLSELFKKMCEDQRSQQALARLRIGLECGGSDGLSGITANPMVGKVSDYVIQYGGTSVLTEVPEMFGAETILMNRCKDEGVFNQCVKMVNDFKDYYKSHNQVIYENPSPGNKAGGITTLEDKSQGCITKAGTSTVMDVLKHTDRLENTGLNLLSAPGNDAVATTALGMCGCQMVLFTTGRGTPFGGFIPTMKIATNSELAKKKKNWIDFDAGRLLDGLSMDAMVEECIDQVIAIASGKKTKNEANNYREIALFKSGVTL